MDQSTTSNMEPTAEPTIEELLALEQARVNTELELADKIEGRFRTRANNRVAKESGWIEALRLYQGNLAYNMSYSKSYENPFGKDRDRVKRDKEINIVARKCDIAIAQGHMRQFAGGDKNWDIQALPNQSGPLNPEEAAVRAERLEETIYKQLTNCKYGYQARLAYKDRVILGTGILKGPINRLRVKKRYVVDPNTQTAVPVLSGSEEPSVVRVDPWMFYPDDTVQTIDEAEDTIEAHPMGKSDLVKLMGRKDFRKGAILELLKEEAKDYRNSPNNTYANFSNNEDLFKGKYTVLEYYGPISKDQMGKLGIDCAYDTPADHYYGEIWVCQGKILRLELMNIEGSETTPYACCVWQEDPGNIFGIGIPLLMRDNQEVVNAAWKMVLDNAQISSGPQIIVDKSLIQPQNSTWEVEPHKIWLATQYGADISKAFVYINPTNQSGPLMEVLQSARAFAEEESGVPLLAQGLQSPTEGDTSATTTAIFNTNSTTILDYMSEQWDDNITQKVVDWMVNWNMQYNPDPSIKADFEIDVKSSTELRRGDLEVRSLEKLLVMSSQDPELGMIMNRQNGLKAWISTMQLPYRDIVKSDEQIQKEAEERAANPQPDPNMMDYEVKMAKIDLEKEELQFNKTAEQERYKMDYDEKVMNAQIRDKEIQGRVIVEQLKYNQELAKLAQSAELEREKLMADLEKSDAEQQAKMFLEGQKLQIAARAQAVKEVEAEQAVKTGEGW